MIAPPRPPANPEALIPEARDRQRRRRIFIAASVSGAAALGLAVFALFGALGRTGPGGPPQAGAQLCRSSQLDANASAEGGGLSTNPIVVAITNTSGSTCALPTGGPAVDLLSRSVNLHPRQRLERGIDWSPRVSMLPPHRRAFVWAVFSFPQRCLVWKSAIVRPSLVLRFSSGLTLHTTADPLVWRPGLSGCFDSGVVDVSPPVAWG
jgi:hypothetical protein